MKMVNNILGDLPSLVEQSQIGRISYVLRAYRRIIDNLASVFGLLIRRIFIAFVGFVILFSFAGAFIHGKTLDPLVHLPYKFLTQMLTDIHKQRGIKMSLFDVGAVAQKVL